MKNTGKKQNKMLVVLKYEFRKMAFNKAFVIITILGPFLLAAITILPSVIAMKSMDRSGETLGVGIYSPSAEALAFAEKTISPAFSQNGWFPSLSGDEESFRARVLDGKLEGYLSVPSAFPKESPDGGFVWYSKSTTDISTFGRVEAIVSSVVVSLRLASSSLDEAKIRALMAPVKVPVFKVSAAAGDDGKETNEADFLATFMTALTFCMLIYMTVLLYGQQIGRSVVAEKSSKIVDILLSSVRSEDLLYGKLLGIGIAGLLQYAVWIGFSVLFLTVIGPAVHFEIPVHIGMDKFGYLVLFFTGGYLLFSSLYAACGAASEDDQHMAQLAMPIIILLMLPMFMLQMIIQQPDSTLAVVLSYIPFTSPMVMLIRTLTGNVALWQIALSLLLLALAVFAMIKLAAKIFRVGILMTGKNFTFKDVFVWIRS